MSSDDAGFPALPRITVSGITLEWDVRQGTCSFEGLPVAMLWVDTTLAGLLAGVQAMVGTDRFALALQSEGRRSVDADWQVIAQFPTFPEGFAAVAQIAAVAGWGVWQLVSVDAARQECRYRVSGNWEGRYQKALGVCWGSGMLAGKLAGYASRLFSTNCWADQVAFEAKGDPFDEFLVKPSERTIEAAVSDLQTSDRATAADMAVALKRLQDEVSERERAVAEARASAARLRAVGDALPDLVLVLDEDGRYIEVLTSEDRLLYLPADQVLGRTVTELFGPEEGARFTDVIGRAIATGSTQTIEYSLPLPSGLTWFEGHVSPVTTLQAPKRLVVFIARDITERKQAERELRRSEEKYRGIFDDSVAPIFVFGHDLQFVDVNQAGLDLLGYSREELLTMRAQDMDVDPARLAPGQAQMEKTGRLVNFEHQLRRRDGTVITVLSNARPLTDDAGHFVGMLSTAFDVTDRKRAEAEKQDLEAKLAQAQKMESIGRLAGGVAHDFNNLLAVQLGYCELMAEKLHPADPLVDWLSEIRACAEKAAGLTRQLLAFGRKQMLQPSEFDLNALVTGIDRLLRRVIGEDVRLVTTTSPQPAIVRADTGQIEQVLINLAANARDAMPRGGRLTIEVSLMTIEEAFAQIQEGATAGPYVVLAVSDTGTGMDEETRTRIFEPFFTTKERAEGTGLGLSTAYGIVRQSGGFLQVYSEVGIGSTFRIFLPQVVSDGAARPEIAAEVAMGTGELILLVEDDASLRKLAEQLVRRLGYHVMAAANADAAFALVEAGLRPNLVLTDVVMPDASGPVLVERLKKLAPGLKVLFMSGYTDEAIVQHGALAPGVNFLQKPFSTESLASKIRDALTGP